MASGHGNLVVNTFECRPGDDLLLLLLLPLLLLLRFRILK